MDKDELEKIMLSDRFASHMGIELILVEAGHAVTRMKLGKEHYNFLGMIHGGAIFSLADVAFAAAANSGGAKAMAIHISIEYLAPVGDTLYLEADVRESGRAGRAGHYTMEVRNDTGVQVAICSGWAYRTTKPLI